MINDFSQLSVDQRQSMEAEAQQALAAAMRDVCRLCLIAREQNDIGNAAGVFGFSKDHAKTWARVAEIFGADLALYMNGSTTLLHNWWKAIADTADPHAVYEMAAAGEWSAARIRREFCPTAAKPKPRRLLATPRRWVAGVLSLNMPANEDPPTPLPERVTVVIEEV